MTHEHGAEFRFRWGGRFGTTRHRLTWRQSLASAQWIFAANGPCVPATHGGGRAAGETGLAVRMSMARTTLETLLRGADPPSDLSKLTRRSTMRFYSDSSARQPLLHTRVLCLPLDASSSYAYSPHPHSPLLATDPTAHCAYRGMYCREVGRGEGGDGRDTRALPFSLDSWSLSTGFSNPIRWRYAERRGGVGRSNAGRVAYRSVGTEIGNGITYMYSLDKNKESFSERIRLITACLEAVLRNRKKCLNLDSGAPNKTHARLRDDTDGVHQDQPCLTPPTYNYWQQYHPHGCHHGD